MQKPVTNCLLQNKIDNFLQSFTQKKGDSREIVHEVSFLEKIVWPWAHVKICGMPSQRDIYVYGWAIECSHGKRNCLTQSTHDVEAKLLRK